jgi:hypothetical protein
MQGALEMKKALCYLALTVVTLSSYASADDWSVYSTTLLGIEQRAVPGFADQTMAPAIQFFGADLNKLGDSNISMHMYGWGRVDLADKSTNEGRTDGDLTYAYMDYRFPRANGEIKGGRFFINEGVAIEQIDGVSAKADLNKYFTLSMFGGAPVKLDWTKNNKGDYIAGGRTSYRLAGILELGVSGLYEGEVTLDTATGKKGNRPMVGGDIWFSPHRTVEVAGHTFYNVFTGGVAENSYLLSFKPLKVVTVTGVYNDQRFKDYFTFSNIHSLFNPFNGGETKSYGGGVTFVISRPFEITADYRHYKRISDVNTDNNGNSDRYGVEARLTLLDKRLRSGLAYHRSDGASGFNGYDEVRGFCLYEISHYVGSIDAIGQFYRHSIYNRGNAFEVIASAGYHILPELALSGDISYGQNPQFDDDLRGLLRLTYTINSKTADKGVKK